MNSLPPLDSLSCPHLLVIGSAWRSLLAQVLVGRFSQVAATVYVGAVDQSSFGRGHVRDLKTLHLLDAFGRRGESLSKLRELLVAQVDGARAGEVGKALDETLLGLNHSAPAPTVTNISCLALYGWFPDELVVGNVEALFNDIDDRACEVGLPRPVLQVRQASTWRDLPRDLIFFQLRERTVARADVRVLFGARPDHEDDWTSFASAGLKPTITDADRRAAVEMRLVVIQSDPKFTAGPEVLRECAEAWVEAYPWRVAASLAMPWTRGSHLVTGETLIHTLAATPGLRDVATMLSASVAGTERMPDVWSGGAWTFDPSRADSLRCSVMIEALHAMATSPGVSAVRKGLVLNADQLFEPGVLVSVQRILAQGRKHNLFVVVLCDRITPSMFMVRDLAPNLLVHRDAVDNISADLLPLPEPLVDPDQAESDEDIEGAPEEPAEPIDDPRGHMGSKRPDPLTDDQIGWMCVGTHRLEPLEQFWNPQEVTIGGRVINGLPIGDLTNQISNDEGVHP